MVHDALASWSGVDNVGAQRNTDAGIRVGDQILVRSSRLEDLMVSSVFLFFFFGFLEGTI